MTKRSCACSVESLISDLLQAEIENCMRLAGGTCGCQLVRSRETGYAGTHDADFCLQICVESWVLGGLPVLVPAVAAQPLSHCDSGTGDVPDGRQESERADGA